MRGAARESRYVRRPASRVLRASVTGCNACDYRATIDRTFAGIDGAGCVSWEAICRPENP